jgi:hypothetical protein
MNTTDWFVFIKFVNELFLPMHIFKVTDWVVFLERNEMYDMKWSWICVFIVVGGVKHHNSNTSIAIYDAVSGVNKNENNLKFYLPFCLFLNPNPN